MRDVVVVCLSVGMLAGCGGGGGGNNGPQSPSPTVISITVTKPDPAAFYIGRTTQLQAQETLSDGTSRAATGLAWQSDNTSIATVNNGLVTAVAAGLVNISAGTTPRGTLQLRVLPNFGGTWSGTEVVLSCVDTGVFRGVCDEPDWAAGTPYLHGSVLVQSNDFVEATMPGPDGASIFMSGPVSIEGELALGPGRSLPADPDVEIVVQNWRARSDVDGTLTGTYEIVFSIPGRVGTFTVGMSLQSVRRVGIASTGDGARASGSHGVVSAARDFLKKR